ncbi:hypothetical protein OEZ86_009656 [Tetradesmus obliquus]|uniref:Uncharacterized protein n=1 Tax=Tetradesmus obliquus TaxID=3088 RepID=A0ABY8UMX0_TETOB|nr:hypothetical protein OEZ85_001100 [Tetradesmus obliquus]WIA43141.1 hypothetical protein OEZ86_009656 [Tetradesmus obliquus]
MNLTPMYVLAFIFLLSSSLLFLLWHCRNAILSRILPQDEFDVEIGRAMHLPGEIYSGSFHSTSAAPAFVIRRLPVFRYPEGIKTAAAAAAAAAAEADGEAVPADHCRARLFNYNELKVVAGPATDNS